MKIQSLGFIGLLFGISALLIAIFATELSDLLPAVPQSDSQPDTQSSVGEKSKPPSKTSTIEPKNVPPTDNDEEKKSAQKEERPGHEGADARENAPSKKQGRLKALVKKFGRKSKAPEESGASGEPASKKPNKTDEKKGLKSVLKERFLKKKTKTKKPQRQTKKSSMTTPRKTSNQWVKQGVMVLSAIAIILGVLGWVRKESLRPAMAAIALGLAALAWKYVLIVAIILIIVLILSALLSAA